MFKILKLIMHCFANPELVLTHTNKNVQRRHSAVSQEKQRHQSNPDISILYIISQGYSPMVFPFLNIDYQNEN